MAIIAVGVAVGVGLGVVSQMLFKPKVRAETRRLGSLSEQTSKEGEPQPIVYGIARPVGGNVIYQSKPIIRIVKEKVGTSKGKGGGKSKTQYQDVEHVYRYYAIRVCRGDGIAYRRIWRNGKLVYDAITPNFNNSPFLKYCKLYSGSYLQMPDATLEGMLGVGNVPAFRGLAYMVVTNEDLTDLAGMIPQYVFEVARPQGVTLTTKPYPLLEVESIGNLSYSFKGGLGKGVINGITNLKYSFDGGVFDTIIKINKLEEIGNLSYDFEGGVRDTAIKLTKKEEIGNLSYDFEGGVRNVIIKLNKNEKIGNLSYNFEGGVFVKTVKYGYGEEIGNLEYSFEGGLESD